MTTNESSRAAFEKWANSDHRDTERYAQGALNPRGDGDYIDLGTDIAWNAWQASEARLLPVLEMAKEALWVAHENSKLWNGEKYNVTTQTGEAFAALNTILSVAASEEGE